MSDGKKRRKQFWLCIAAGMLFAFPNQNAKAQTDSNNTLSQSTYLLYCATCHGRTGKGDGPMAQLLIKPPTDLTMLAVSNQGRFPYGRLEGVIDGRKSIASHGVREMPIWGTRFRQEAETPGNALPRDRQVSIRIKGLIDYIASIQER